MDDDRVSDALDRLSNRNSELQQEVYNLQNDLADLKSVAKRVLRAWDVLPDWSNGLEAAIAELRNEVAR